SAERAPVERDLRREVAEGLRWLWANPLIRYMAFLTGAINLVNAGVPLTLIVLAKATGATDAQVGAIFGISGIGGIVGSLIGGQIQKRFRFGQVIAVLVWVEALLFPLYAIMPSYVFLGAIGALHFLLSPIYN